MTQTGLGMVHVYTGPGKGKTTSSMGLATRAKGRGFAVKIIQLFKQSTGEKKTMDLLEIPYVQFIPLHPYFKEYQEEQFKDLQKELLRFWNAAITDLEAYDVVVIDEVGPALNWGVLPKQVVLDFLAQKPEHVELVMTGRDFPEEVLQKADYVTEFNSLKHPYEKGILARKGIEF